MNHRHRLVINKTTQVWQAVSELAKSHSKSSAKTVLPIVLTLGRPAWAEINLNALLAGGNVVAGQSQISQNNNQLNITETT